MERAIDSVLHPVPEAAQAAVFGDPTRLAAHEIRGHLAVLAGYLSLVREGDLGEVPEAVARVLQQMDAKAHAISHLVDDMLEDARFQDGRLHLARRVVDLTELVENTADEMRASLSDRHSLELRVPEGAVVAEADPGRVRTILRNLLDNAAKYSPEGGPIECRLESGDDVAKITVADRGLGIEAADAELVFKRFGRARASESAIPGVGLGLYICRTLARLHGGDIAVRRRRGGGSEFVVTLPLQQPPAT